MNMINILEIEANFTVFDRNKKIDYPYLCGVIEGLLQKAGILEGVFELRSGETYQRAEFPEAFVDKNFDGANIRFAIPANGKFSHEVLMLIPAGFRSIQAKKLHSALYTAATGKELKKSCFKKMSSKENEQASKKFVGEKLVRLDQILAAIAEAFPVLNSLSDLAEKMKKMQMQKQKVREQRRVEALRTISELNPGKINVERMIAQKPGKHRRYVA